MGQYHETFAISKFPNEKAEHFSHYALAGGAKLCEQNYTWVYDPDYEWGSGTMPKGTVLASPCAAAHALMITMGPWAKRRIVTVGDYHEGAFAELFGAPSHLVNDVTAEVTALTAEAFGFQFRADGASPWLELTVPDDFIFRIDKMKAMHIQDEDLVLVADAGHSGEYLEPRAFGSPSHPVASCLIGGLWPVALIMTAVSDGLGGGDARFEPAGRWAHSIFSWATRRSMDTIGAENVTDWALSQQEVSSHILNRA